MDALPDIAPFQRRLDELDAQMAEPAFYNNSRKAAEISREQQKVQQLIENHREYERLERELMEALTLSRDPLADAELRELATSEIPELDRRRADMLQAVM